LDNVGCSGAESRLIDCSHNAIGSHDCSHSEDAGVTCLAPGANALANAIHNLLHCQIDILGIIPLPTLFPSLY
jgi:hypothetical protein